MGLASLLDPISICFARRSLDVAWMERSGIRDHDVIALTGCGLIIMGRAVDGKLMRTLKAGSGEFTDRAPRFVRVTNENRKGFVEFQFSIGDPDLYIEMLLPHRAFAAFCEEHEVQYLDEDAALAVDAKQHKWRYGNEDEK